MCYKGDHLPPGSPFTHISNDMLSKVWDEITYTFSNLNGYTVEVFEWISNFTPHNYLSTLGLKLTHVSKRGPAL